MIRAVGAALLCGTLVGCASAPANEHSDAYARKAACVAPSEHSEPVSISDPVSAVAVAAISMAGCGDGLHSHGDAERAWLARERILRERAAQARRAQAAADERAAAAADAPPRG